MGIESFEDFEVTGTSDHYFITQDGKTFAGPYSKREFAEAALDRARRGALARERKCMTCRTSFLSEGPHNRMCGPCRNRSAFIEI